MKYLCVYVIAIAVCWSAMGAASVDFLTWRGGRVGASPEIQTVEKWESAKKYKKAARAFARIEKKTDDDSVAAYAALARGDSYYQAGKQFKAMDAYTHAVTSYPQFGNFTHGLDMLRVIAEDFAQGRINGFFKSFHKKDARDLYRQIIRLAPYGDRTGKDMLRLAELEREAFEINEAIHTYQLILERFAGTRYAKTARVKLSETFLKEARNTRDTIRLVQSAELYADQALRDNPNQPEVLDIKRKAAKIYAEYYSNLGEFYAGKAHYDPSTAARYYHQVIHVLPGSKEASAAAAQLAKLSEQGHAPSRDADRKPADIRRVPDPEKAIPGLKIDENASPDDVVPKVIPSDGKSKKYLLPIKDLGQ